MEALNYLHYMKTLLTDINTTVSRLTLGVFSLKEGVKSFYEYMLVLASPFASSNWSYDVSY